MARTNISISNGGTNVSGALVDGGTLTKAPVLTVVNLNGGTSLEIGKRYQDSISSPRTLTFSGTPAEGSSIGLKLLVTSACLLSFPFCKRFGTDNNQIESLNLTVGNHQFTWQYIGGEWILADTVRIAETREHLLRGTWQKGGEALTVSAVDPNFVQLPWNVTVTGWKIFSEDNTNGSATFDIRVASGSYPTSGNSIVGSLPPTLTTATSASHSSLSGWSTTIASGFNVTLVPTSFTSIKKVTLQLNLTETL